MKQFEMEYIGLDNCTQLQKRIVAHNVKQFFINALPICRICLETEDDSRGTATLNKITIPIWNYLKLKENHYPKWICTKCERIIIDFIMLTNKVNESNQFIQKIETLMNDDELSSFQPNHASIMINLSEKTTDDNLSDVGTFNNNNEMKKDEELINEKSISQYEVVEYDIEYTKSNSVENQKEFIPLLSPSVALGSESTVIKDEDYLKENEEMEEEYLESDDVFEVQSNLDVTVIQPGMVTHTFEGELLKCNFCEKLSTSKKNHNMHVATSHTKPHICPIDNCNKRFGLPSLVKRHILQMHSGSKKEHIETNLQCSYCNQIFTERFKLNAHLKQIHAEADKICTVCGKRFNEVKMKVHMKIHAKLFECDLCNQRYGNKFMLKKHIQEKHLGRKDYLCTNCGMRFGSAQKLRRHVLSKHNNNKNKPGILPDELRGYCKYKNCGLRFSDKTDLINHSKEHSLIHKCKTCCRRFASKVALDKHEKVHDNFDYPFECLHCKGRYKSKTALHKHMSKIHITRRWFCSLCNKSLSSHRSLVSHEKQHQSIRDFGCFYCDKMFFTTRRLKEHLIAVHTESRYQCPKCSQKFVCSRGISSHLNREHPGCLEIQPDVSVYFEKDESNYNAVLHKYKSEMAKRYEKKQKTGAESNNVQFEIIDLGFLDRREIN